MSTWRMPELNANNQALMWMGFTVAQFSKRDTRLFVSCGLELRICDPEHLGRIFQLRRRETCMRYLSSSSMRLIGCSLLALRVARGPGIDFHRGRPDCDGIARIVDSINPEP
jgi:hypothetical protein